MPAGHGQGCDATSNTARCCCRTYFRCGPTQPCPLTLDPITTITTITCHPLSVVAAAIAMPDALAIVFLVSHIVLWPLVKLANVVISILSPICTLAAFLLLPFIHLAHVFAAIVAFPFQVKWLERIEVTMAIGRVTAPSKLLQTLYIYLGTATLIGCLTGGILFAIFNFVSSTLNIDQPRSSPPKQGRTAAEFKAARRERQQKAAAFPTVVLEKPPTPVLSEKLSTPRRRGLLSQTIDEEEDSDY
jgi:hypothetical protein